MFLITAFDPFDGAPTNPSMELLEAYGAQPDAQVCQILPTSFERGGAAIVGLIQEHRPQALIMLGVAGDREVFSLEESAYNWDDARIADNAGFQPRGRVIWEEGPASYASTLPLVSFKQALESAGIPVGFSQDPGRFVCNHVFYRAMHQLAQAEVSCPAGFVHIPPFAAVSLADGVRALNLMVAILSAQIS